MKSFNQHACKNTQARTSTTYMHPLHIPLCLSPITAVLGAAPQKCSQSQCLCWVSVQQSSTQKQRWWWWWCVCVMSSILMESAECGGNSAGPRWNPVWGQCSTLVESELFMYGSAQWLIPPWSTFSIRATRKMSGWGHVTEKTPCGQRGHVKTHASL